MNGGAATPPPGATGRFGHYLFGVIQSGLTCLISSGIASLPFLDHGDFLGHWLRSWLIAWVAMLPVVIVAAPFIQRIVLRIVGH